MAININIPSQFLDYNNLAAFPATGSAKILYVAKDTNKLYRWDGSAYVEVSASQASSWGSITGNLASQVDLQGELDNKVNTESGKGLSTNDYTTTEKNKLAGIAAGAEVNVNADWNATSGDAQILNKPTIPSAAGLVPYTGATTNVDLGTHTLSAKDLIINHSSGSGDAATITKGGSGEALKVVKTSGSGNAASITGGVTQLDELHLTTDLADSYISSAATWNAKQEQLVSGTNIKTINGTTVLGSGDITISAGGTEWGDITGDLFNQTDLQAQLDSKQEYLFSGTNIKTINSTSVLGSGNIAVQPTLVSGTNIKTINGSSVLGSGDLTISGGGGAFGSYIFPASSGVAINPTCIPIVSEFNSAGIVNRCVTFAFVPSTTITISALRLKVNTLIVGSNARILIFDNLVDVPNNKIFESSNLDCSTIGLKTATTTQTFTAGTVYWLAIHTSSTQTLAGFNNTSLINIKSSTSVPVASVYAYSKIATFGSFPSTFGVPTEVNTGVIPAVQLIIA